MKKMMLLALAAISALLALPAFASATPAHINPQPAGQFTVHGGASELSRASGGGTHGSTTTGKGEFESTTTGWVELTFHNVTGTLGNCSTTPTHPHSSGPGTVTTTKLPFHLVMLSSGVPGILITPNAETGVLAHFTCGAFNTSVTVAGSGILGTITSPECGKSSTSATLSFTGEAGVQKHLTWTGNTYDLNSTILGGTSTSAMNAHATILLSGSSELVCT